MKYRTPNSVPFLLLNTLVKSNTPMTMAELGYKTRPPAQRPRTNRRRLAIIERERIQIPLRYLRRYGLIERVPGRRYGTAPHSYRGAYLYQPTDNGRLWLRDTLTLGK